MKTKRKNQNRKSPNKMLKGGSLHPLKKPKVGVDTANAKEPVHDHKYKKVLFNLAVPLTMDAKYEEMISKVVCLLKTGRKVDKNLVMKPIDKKKINGNLSSHLKVPNNFTDLGAYVEILHSGKRDPFVR